MLPTLIDVSVTPCTVVALTCVTNDACNSPNVTTTSYLPITPCLNPDNSYSLASKTSFLPVEYVTSTSSPVASNSSDTL